MGAALIYADGRTDTTKFMSAFLRPCESDKYNNEGRLWISTVERVDPRMLQNGAED